MESLVALNRGSGFCIRPQLFAVGGFDGLRRLRSVERYDPFSNTWEATAPLPEAVSSAAVAPCAGQLYVIGGAGQDGVNTDKVCSGLGVRIRGFRETEWPTVCRIDLGLV